MNIQEVIRKMHEAGVNCKAIKYASQFDKGYNNGIAYAINLLDKLDEPEKPVVPQFVADFYESIKDNIENEIYDLCVQFGNGESELDKDILFWFDNSKNEPIQTLVNMHQFGYEVEKERLYTAKLKLTNEYLHYDKNYKEIRHYKIPDDVANKAEGYHFTEDDLIAYNAWGDNAYEVNEVEDD